MFLTLKIQVPKPHKLLIFNFIADQILRWELILSNELMTQLSIDWAKMETSIKYEQKYFRKLKWLQSSAVFDKIRFALNMGVRDSFMGNV